MSLQPYALLQGDGAQLGASMKTKATLPFSSASSAVPGFCWGWMLGFLAKALVGGVGGGIGDPSSELRWWFGFLLQLVKGEALQEVVLALPVLGQDALSCRDLYLRLRQAASDRRRLRGGRSRGRGFLAILSIRSALPKSL